MFIKCRCGKELKSNMEVEYSRHLTEFFCSPDCATDRYFEYMESCCVDMEQPLPEDVEINNDGFLVKDAEQSFAADASQREEDEGNLNNIIRDGIEPHVRR